MSDLIRRSDAIKALYKYSFVSKDIIEREINAIPSADRPRGEWIMSDIQNEADISNGNYSYVCTNCNHTDIHAKTQKVPYCWWCCAKMKGADDEAD